jgi:hypothetical protein
MSQPTPAKPRLGMRAVTMQQPFAAAMAAGIGLFTRRGKPIAELVPRCSVRDLLPQLAALREALPKQQASGVETMRLLRDESRP